MCAVANWALTPEDLKDVADELNVHCARAGISQDLRWQKTLHQKQGNISCGRGYQMPLPASLSHHWAKMPEKFKQAYASAYSNNQVTSSNVYKNYISIRVKWYR